MQMQTQNPKNPFRMIINVLSPKTNHLVKLHSSSLTYVKLRTSPQNISNVYFSPQILQVLIDPHIFQNIQISPPKIQNSIANP